MPVMQTSPLDSLVALSDASGASGAGGGDPGALTEREGFRI